MEVNQYKFQETVSMLALENNNFKNNIELHRFCSNKHSASNLLSCPFVVKITTASRFVLQSVPCVPSIEEMSNASRRNSIACIVMRKP